MVERADMRFIVAHTSLKCAAYRSERWNIPIVALADGNKAHVRQSMSPTCVRIQNRTPATRWEFISCLILVLAISIIQHVVRHSHGTPCGSLGS
eukprot:scaffold240952_cov23-Prasinocladus_malaysianus.AAC.1